jgi:hypothetical protein
VRFASARRFVGHRSCDILRRHGWVRDHGYVTMDYPNFIVTPVVSVYMIAFELVSAQDCYCHIQVRVSWISQPALYALSTIDQDIGALLARV